MRNKDVFVGPFGRVMFVGLIFICANLAILVIVGFA